MASHHTRQVATYLRDGSLWVGHFVDSRGELNFGDDRFDATHGLANAVRAEATSSTSEKRRSKRVTRSAVGTKTSGPLRPVAWLERFHRPVSARRDAASPARKQTAQLYPRLLSLVCAELLCIVFMGAQAQAGDSSLKTIAILAFDLLDDQSELAPATVEYRRLRDIRNQLQAEFASNHLYRVVDLTPASELIDKYRAQTPLYACNGCELEIARALRADRVLVGWVQKVSNLILNINIQVEDAATGAILLNKSVDLRGNTDETWSRGVSHIVRSMVEKGQGNR